MQSQETSLTRVGAVCLGVSGVLFVAWPVIRPFSDLSSDPRIVAQTFASIPWIQAHVCAMFGFVLLPLGLGGLYASLRDSPAERSAFRGLVFGWIGVALALPYFGIETFAIRVISQKALMRDTADLVALAQAVRVSVGVVFFFLGLLLLALAAVMFAFSVWKSNVLARWSGIPFSVGLALYLPQFLLPQTGRIMHGLLVGIGCFWISWAILQRSAQ